MLYLLHVVWRSDVTALSSIPFRRLKTMSCVKTKLPKQSYVECDGIICYRFFYKKIQASFSLRNQDKLKKYIPIVKKLSTILSDFQSSRHSSFVEYILNVGRDQMLASTLPMSESQDRHDSFQTRSYQVWQAGPRSKVFESK